MGTEYDLISDKARVGYQLGKGPWSDLTAALRSPDPVSAIIALMHDAGFEDGAYCAEVCGEVTQFAEAHPDWRVIDEYSSDILVMTDEERAEEEADEDFGEDEDFPIYKLVGSRYRENAPSDVSPMAIEPADEEIVAELRREDARSRTNLVVTKAGLNRLLGTKDGLEKLIAGQRDRAGREAKAALRFESGTIAPHSKITAKIVEGSVIYVKNGQLGGKQHMEFLAREQLGKIEVFRPLWFTVKSDDGDLWVESVRVNGHENLVGGGASSLMFNGAYEVHMDSGKPQDFEITLRNDSDEPRTFKAGVDGRALLVRAP